MTRTTDDLDRVNELLDAMHYRPGGHLKYIGPLEDLPEAREVADAFGEGASHRCQYARCVISSTGADRRRLYLIFRDMVRRCSDQARPADAKYYAGKGIQVRFASFVEFEAWAHSAGYAPNLTIDRVDPEGHYEPANLRWSDRKTQAQNRTNVRRFEAFGEVKTLGDWAEDPRSAVSYSGLRSRWVARPGVPFEQLLTTNLYKTKEAR